VGAQPVSVRLGLPPNYTAPTRMEGQQERAQYQRALELDPTDVDALIGLADLERKGGETEEAKALYRRAVSVAPNDTRALISLAALLDEDEQVPSTEVVTLLRRAFELDPADPTCLRNLVHTLGEIGEDGEVDQAYRRAGDSGSAEALFELGARLDERGDVDEAESLYRRALASGHVEALDNLTVLLEERGATADARTLYRDSVASGHAARLRRLRSDGQRPTSWSAPRHCSNAWSTPGTLRRLTC
jgi:Flp pilus assembly protein TadD